MLGLGGKPPLGRPSQWQRTEVVIVWPERIAGVQRVLMRRGRGRGQCEGEGVLRPLAHALVSPPEGVCPSTLPS